MILKSRPREKSIPMLLGVVVFLSGFSLTHRSLEDEVYAAYDSLMSHNLGFSSMNRVGDSIPEAALNYVKAIPAVLKANTVGHRDAPEIPHLGLDIKFEDYKMILADRDRGIREGFLRDPVEVNAQVVFRGKTYKAGVRLKGDISDHWRSRHRMSLRVNLDGGESIMGFASFSIHKPAARQHPYDQVFQDMVREMGNLSAVHKYASVTVNGESWGIMNVEEHVSKEFIEKQRSKDSLIMRFSNEDYFLYRERAKNPYHRYLVSENNLFTKPYSPKRYFSNDVSRRHFSYASRLLLERKFDQLFDRDSLMRNLLLASAWGNFHTLAPSNSRYYLNPYDLKLHPITTDQGKFYDITERRGYFSNPVFDWMASSPDLDDVAVRHIKSLQAVVGGADKRFGQYNRIFPADQKIDAGPLFENLRFISDDPAGFVRELLSVDPRERRAGDYVFDFGQGVILPPDDPQAGSPTAEQVREMLDFVHIRHFDDGTVEIYNLLPVDVRLTKLAYNGGILKDAPLVVPGYGPDKSPKPLVVRTGIRGIQDGLISAETELLGCTRTTGNDFTFVTEGLANPLSRSHTESEAPFLVEEDGKLIARAGTWYLRGPITVDGDLTIEPGTQLLFSPEAYLIVKGSLTALGTEEDPIKILPQKDTFKGIYVFKADSKSYLSHTIFGRTSGVEEGLLQLTGGVTFYMSDVHMDKVAFLGTVGEDALNIVRSKFSINNLTMAGTRSDGFDCDFSNGAIRDSEFSDIGGDAVDFSGSVVEVAGMKIHHIKDKAVSVGEESIVHVRDGFFHDVGVGLAAKDGSYAVGERLQIESYDLHAAMTYKKKDFFVEPVLELVNSEVGAGDQYFRQIGSSLTVGGIPMPERQLSVSELYQGPVMKK